jgi:Asp-tRNA(Asn)/Glu-tRNA(Gln) amidotransferase A subunit family amidase
MTPVAGAPWARRLVILGWSAYLGSEDRRTIAVGFGGGEAWSPLGELGRALRGRPRVTSGALMYWMAAHYGSLLARGLRIDGARWRELLRAQVRDLIGERGVAVCPIFPTTAPRHGWTKRALLTTLGYQAWVNLAGLPGIAVPIGRSGNGLPVGVQIVGAPGAEHTILAAGLAMQRALMPEWCGPPLLKGLGVRG